MKKLLSTLFATLLVLCALSTYAGKLISPMPVPKHILQEREVENFTGVAAGGPIDVVIKFGNKEGLRFEGDKEAIATLVAEVKSNILIIRPKTSWTSWAKKYENKKITAYVTAKQISSLTMSGDGSISVSGTIEAEEFTATLSGSGNIKASVAVSRLTGVLSGSGNVVIDGSADAASVTMSGPGTFGSKSLVVDDLSARISGKGNINITCNQKLKAFISGSGHVYYSGDPEVHRTVIGAGGVSKR